MSDYQNLVEGKCEVVVTNKDTKDEMNLTSLLRNLYAKIYKIEADLVALKNPESKDNKGKSAPEPPAAGPPE